MTIFEQAGFPFPGAFPVSGIRAEAEAYAASLGQVRGTPGWGDAVRHYALTNGSAGIGSLSLPGLPPRAGIPTNVVPDTPHADPASATTIIPTPAPGPAPSARPEDEPVRGSWDRWMRPERDPGLEPGPHAEAAAPVGGADDARTLPVSGPSRPEIQLAQIPPEMNRGRWRTPELMGRPRFPRALTALSEKYELPREGGGAGTISSGRSDPGGQSYGRQQLALKMGSVKEFLASEHADPWREELKGLKPGSAQFNAKWREIAAREPAAVDEATFRFVEQRHYRTAVATAKRVAKLDLDGMSDPVRAVVWSTIVQHGGWNDILVPAIRDADRRAGSWGRGSPQYDMALIISIYEQRMRNELRKYVAPNATRAAKARARKMVEGRYLPEMEDALALWRADRQE